MTEVIVPTVYFASPGPENTERALQVAHERATALGIEHVVIASSTGTTGAQAARVFEDRTLVVISHSTGFSGPNVQRLTPENRQIIEDLGDVDDS